MRYRHTSLPPVAVIDIVLNMSSPFNFMQALDAGIYAPFAYMSLDETPMVVAEYGTPHTELEIENVILDVQRKSMVRRMISQCCNSTHHETDV